MNKARVIDAAYEGLYILLSSSLAIMIFHIIALLYYAKPLPSLELKHFWYPIWYALGRFTGKAFDHSQ